MDEYYGYSKAQWDDALDEIAKVLRRCAKDESFVTYSDLAARLKSISVEPRDHAFHMMLGAVSAREDEAGRPLISALVVHKGSDNRPGPGFFDLAESLGKRVGDRDAFWSDEIARIFNHWSSRRQAERPQSAEPSFQVHEFPEEFACLDYSAEFSADEMATIRRGLIPREMEEKWLIAWSDEDCALRLYRSWTGYCVYEVTFRPGETGSWMVRTARVSRERSQYTGEDARYETELLDYLIRSLLLNQSARFPDFGGPLEAWSVLGSASLTAPREAADQEPADR